MTEVAVQRSGPSTACEIARAVLDEDGDQLTDSALVTVRRSAKQTLHETQGRAMNPQITIPGRCSGTPGTLSSSTAVYGDPS